MRDSDFKERLEARKAIIRDEHPKFKEEVFARTNALQELQKEVELKQAKNKLKCFILFMAMVITGTLIVASVEWWDYIQTPEFYQWKRRVEVFE